ncbi:MAG: hypothetical protein IPJ27_24515 [Candidatus Accumulibacter sp.]|uniref:Uncharacterized protein n=1 Tax=Candidatus Accumulibacter proximus TaxID=2954385 RepID=A0A935Q3S3_9PROT|nr:hypothetical protein [Candidatus Accumulibacter proximus]
MRKIDVAHYHYLACLASLLADEGAQALTQHRDRHAIARRYGGPQQHALGSLAQAQALHASNAPTKPGPCWRRPPHRPVDAQWHLCFQADL